MMSKVEVFNKEYTYIKDEKNRENLKKLVGMLPDYFFEVAASSTGKYHPTISLGKGGLVRHSKTVVRIGNELLLNNCIGNIFTPNEKDLMLCALLVHDGLKHGINYSEYTAFDHPLQMAKFIRDNKEKFTWTDDEIEFIAKCIETHMGEWTKDYRGNEILEKPSNRYQKFVHMCDFLASRKFLDIRFENGDIID